jgi:hypothetical protein
MNVGSINFKLFFFTYAAMSFIALSQVNAAPPLYSDQLVTQVKNATNREGGGEFTTFTYEVSPDQKTATLTERISLPGGGTQALFTHEVQHVSTNPEGLESIDLYFNHGSLDSSGRRVTKKSVIAATTFYVKTTSQPHQGDHPFITLALLNDGTSAVVRKLRLRTVVSESRELATVGALSSAKKMVRHVTGVNLATDRTGTGAKTSYTFAANGDGRTGKLNLSISFPGSSSPFAYAYQVSNISDATEDLGVNNEIDFFLNHGRLDSRGRIPKHVSVVKATKYQIVTTSQASQGDHPSIVLVELSNGGSAIVKKFKRNEVAYSTKAAEINNTSPGICRRSLQP